MTDIRTLIKDSYPKLDDLPFCKALSDGRFGREEILRAEIVELYRALNTRHKIQSYYKDKLAAAVEAGVIKGSDFDLMEEVIDDEGETEEHIDHLDMRFKLFAGTPVSRAATLKFNEELDAINNEWMDICRDSNLFEMMAFTAGIEDWYAPLSAFFEEEYRKRGFSEDELELFIVHKEADVDHSEAQFDILERCRDRFSVNDVKNMLDRTFATSKGYDTQKLVLAETECDLSDLLK